jgi:hypothetical protein
MNTIEDSDRRSSLAHGLGARIAKTMSSAPARLTMLKISVLAPIPKRER